MDSYVDIQIETPLRDRYFILTKIYRVIHGQISNSFPGRIAISFPDWEDHHFDETGHILKKGSLGGVLRLLGEQDDLIHFHRNPALSYYAEIGAAVLAPISEIPRIDRFVRFKRDRKAEKQFPGFTKRMNRRRQKNNLEKISSSQYSAENHQTKTTHHLALKSSTNQYRFSLFINREFCISGPNEFNNYGLCKNNSSIPHF